MAPAFRSSMGDNSNRTIAYRVGSEAHPVLKKNKKKREKTRRHTMYYTSQVQNSGAAPGRRSPRSSTWFVILTLRSDRSQSRRRPRWQAFTSSFRAQDISAPTRSLPNGAPTAAAAAECVRQKLCSRKRARTRLGRFANGTCCIRQGLSPVLMPLPGLAPVSPYFGLRPVGRLSLPK